MANKDLLIVTGSVRPNSVNQKVVPIVKRQAEALGYTVKIADLKELNMPFIDTELHPMQPEFSPKHQSVIKWTELVREAGGVVFVTPEYNHTMTPVQLNAVDWIAKEWHDKPISLIGYGISSGGKMAQNTARESLGMMKAKVGQITTNLFLGKDVAPNGEILDEESVLGQIKQSLIELRSLIEE